MRQKSRGRISPGGPQAAEEESSGLSQQPGCLPSERKWSADHGRTLLTGHEMVCRPDIRMRHRHTLDVALPSVLRYWE